MPGQALQGSTPGGLWGTKRLRMAPPPSDDLRGHASPHTGGSSKASVELWDTSGNARYQSCWPAIMKDAHGILFVFNPAHPIACQPQGWGQFPLPGPYGNPRNPMGVGWGVDLPILVGGGPTYPHHPFPYFPRRQFLVTILLRCLRRQRKFSFGGAMVGGGGS